MSKPGRSRMSNACPMLGEALEPRTLFAADGGASEFVPPPAPALTDIRFDARYAPHAIHFVFTEDVSASLDHSDLVMFHESGRFILPMENISIDWDAETNTASFVFARLDDWDGVLPEGKWFARLRADGVYGSSGYSLEQDAEFDFTFLRGDANGDGAVNQNDVDILMGNFGMSGASFEDGDFNYDGTVNLDDFNIISERIARVNDDGPSMGPPFSATRLVETGSTLDELATA